MGESPYTRAKLYSAALLHLVGFEYVRLTVGVPHEQRALEPFDQFPRGVILWDCGNIDVYQRVNDEP